MSTQALKSVATGKQEKKSITDLTIEQMMSSSSIKNQLALAMPKHLTADRLARIATTEMRKVPKLAQCDQVSFLGAIMQCAQLGLEPGSALGHAYLIPFNKNKKVNGKWVVDHVEVQFIIGYRGMIDLARRSGQIISISAHTVYENDKFSYELGLHEDLIHKPADRERGKMIYVYAVARLKDGGVQFEVMSKFDVDLIRAQSKAGADGPWATHYDEMAKKTVIRRLFKYLPVSIEMTQAVIADEKSEAGISQENSAFITGEYQIIDNEEIPKDEEKPETQSEVINKETGEITQPVESGPDPKQATDFQTLLDSINKSTDIDILDANASLIDTVVGISQREELTRKYRAKRAELEQK